MCVRVCVCVWVCARTCVCVCVYGGNCQVRRGLGDREAALPGGLLSLLLHPPFRWLRRCPRGPLAHHVPVALGPISLLQALLGHPLGRWEASHLPEAGSVEVGGERDSCVGCPGVTLGDFRAGVEAKALGVQTRWESSWSRGPWGGTGTSVRAEGPLRGQWPLVSEVGVPQSRLGPEVERGEGAEGDGPLLEQGHQQGPGRG